MGDFCREFWAYIDHMKSGDWLIVATVGLVLGALCLRGLGSRSSY